MNPQQEIDCLRAKIRDFLVASLDSESLKLDLASQIAQTTLDLLPNGLSLEQLKIAISQLKQKYPQQYAAIHAVELSCALDQARISIDQEVLSLIASGNLDAALAKIDQFQLQ